MENDLMNTSAYNRRHYPKDIQGKKSEWYGIEQHMLDINQEIERNERDIKTLRKKELLSELDKKILEQLQVKQLELEAKFEDAQQMKRRHQIYQDEEKKFLEDKMNLQRGVMNIYDKQKHDAMVKELDMRQQKLEWELHQLEENRKRIEQEAIWRKQHKDQWAKEQDADLRLNELRHMEERQKMRNDQLEIQELNRRNAEREMIKEENYRNFYKQCAQNQVSLQKLHIDNVLQPLLERQVQLEQLIAKNVDVYQRKLLQDELDRVMKRQQEYQQTQSVNKSQMNHKEQERDLEKQYKTEVTKQRLEDLNQYNQYQIQQKYDQSLRQKQYKDHLDQQRIEKEEQRLHQLRMGRQEKSMNMLDLQAYKKQDPQLNAKIIGWQPQIGQLPPKQDQMLKQQSLTQLKQQELDLINNNISQVSQASQATRGGTFRGVGQQTINQQHNPLTNPIPYNNQNPYIQKQYEQLLRFRS